MLVRNFFSPRRLYRTVRITYTINRERAWDKRRLRSIDGTPFPELTKDQKKEIKVWYEKYGLSLNGYYYHRWYYDVTGSFSPSCISEPILYRQIMPIFNDFSIAEAWADKAYYDHRFRSPCIDMPDTVIRNINGIFYDSSYNWLDLREAQVVLAREEKVIAKPTRNSGQGENVRIYTSKNGILSILDDYASNYIVQRVVEQHDILAKLNPTSVNTFRIMSWFNEGEVYILVAMLRVGTPGAWVDNLHAGGFALSVKEDGTIIGPGRDGKGRVVKGTDNIISDSNELVKYYEKIIASVKELHPQLPYFGIIAWDITIDKKGSPVLIEYNLRYPAFDTLQALCGTFKGDVWSKLFFEAKRRNDNLKIKSARR